MSFLSLEFVKRIDASLKSILILLISFALVGCPESVSENKPIVNLPVLGITFPIPAGWVLDKSVQYTDPAKGGTLFQLIRDSAVPGSPRITGSISPLSTRSVTLKQAVKNARRALKTLQNQQGLVIQYSSTSEIKFINKPAMKLAQSYTLGSGSSQLSVTQIEIVSVHKNRTLSLTAAGRTELFTPLEEEINSIIESGQYIETPPSKN